MADSARARKVADRIKVLTAEALRDRVKDERLGMVTITDVRVTGDLQQSTIFYTVLGDAEELANNAAALQDNKGRIRSYIGQGLGIRLTPSIEFVADALPEGAAHMEQLLAEARKRDEELARSRGAQYAGDADPYRRDDEDDDSASADSASDEEFLNADATEADGAERPSTGALDER